MMHSKSRQESSVLEALDVRERMPCKSIRNTYRFDEIDSLKENITPGKSKVDINPYSVTTGIVSNESVLSILEILASR